MKIGLNYLEKIFLKKGFLVNLVENKKALNYINNFTKEKLLKIIYPAVNNSKKFSFNNLHKLVEYKNLNKIRLDLIEEINKNKNFRNCYFNLAKNKLFEVVGNELSMQNNINISIQFPNDQTSLLPMHSDTWSGDSPFEVVVWLPLVNCYKSKSMFILEASKDAKFRKLYSKNFKFSSNLYKSIKKDLKFIKIDYGQFLLFNQNLPHGNIINTTKETRFSFNCRFKGLFTPYSQKKLGSFFSPIKVRAASIVGLNYKFPGE